ncbi:MAG: CBS domain-containing protein [Thermodesulfobacteriota bacterium]
MTERFISEIVTPKVVAVAPDTPLPEVLALMRQRRISCVVVLEKGRPVGIVTERNFLWAAAHGFDCLSGRRIAELMSTPVTTIAESSPIYEAYNLLSSRGVRHLVVVDEDGRACGVVTQSNLVRQLGYDYLAEIKKVGDIMHPDLISVPPDTPVREAVRRMADRGISCVVAAENGRPQGVLTERDVVGLILERKNAADLPLSAVMSAPVRTIHLEAPAFEAALGLERHGIRRLVVVDDAGDGRGIITQTDIIRGLESKYVRTLKQVLRDRDERLEEVGRSLVEKTVFLDSILRSSLDMGVVATDRSFRVAYFNPAAEDILGYSAAEALGKDARQVHLLEGIELSRLTRMLDRLAPDSAHTFEFVRERNGEERTYRARVSGVWGRDRELNGYVLMARDVTERKRAQEDLARLTRRLEQTVVERTREYSDKARELEQANQRLRGLDEMKSSFLSAVSHELRTPLTSLLGFAKLIARDFSRTFLPLAGEDAELSTRAGRIRDNLGIITEEGERLTRLINDFLDLAKIESGRMIWHDRPASLARVAERAVHAVRGDFQDRPELELVLDLEPDLPMLQVDPDRLEQVLINLLSNAAKFTARGAVTVRGLRVPGNLVRVEVADTGMGIAWRDLTRVFDKFHQARREDTMAQKPKGTGLGLAICREIVEHYGGRIWAEAEPEKGSTFVFQLPVEKVEVVSPAPILPGEALEDAGRPLVLVVDDDPAVCSYLLQFLESEGYRAAAATDGGSALSAARELSPDLITMDLLMPSMDGRAVMNVLRGDPDLKNVPILVISAIPEGDPGWGDAALAKPINEDKLLETVHALLTRRYSKRLVNALMRIFPDRRDAFFSLLGGEIARLDEEQFKALAEGGFAGTLVVPARAARREDIREVLDRPGLHVLVLPEEGGQAPAAP